MNITEFYDKLVLLCKSSSENETPSKRKGVTIKCPVNMNCSYIYKGEISQHFL